MRQVYHFLIYLPPHQFRIPAALPCPHSKRPIYWTRYANANYYWPRIRVPGKFISGGDAIIPSLTHPRGADGRIFVELA